MVYTSSDAIGWWKKVMKLWTDKNYEHMYDGHRMAPHLLCHNITFSHNALKKYTLESLERPLD